MSFTVIECEQRSPDWHAARIGRLTGSRASDMLATIKSGEAAARRNLRVQLVLERITGRSHDKDFQSQAMRDGVEREADAALVYEALTGRFLQRTGFLSHDSLMAGCSLDGHVGDYEGIVEVKSPMPATHLSYLRTGKVPEDYYRQVLHNLWVTGAQWCDWLSYQPDFPEPGHVKLVRVSRDEAAIADYDRKARAFLAEVDTEVAAVKTMLDSAEQWRRSTEALV